MKISLIIVVFLLAYQPCSNALFSSSSFLRMILEGLSVNRAPTACSDDCLDKSPTCFTMSKDHCTSPDPRSLFLMKPMCPFTCGLCTPCVKRTAGCRTGPCNDMDRLFCPLWRWQNMCHLPKVIRLCQKTCDLCAPECSLPPLEICDKDCSDSSEHCKFWHEYDATYCDKDSEFSDVRIKCEKTCGVCKPCNTTTVAPIQNDPIPASSQYDPMMPKQ